MCEREECVFQVTPYPDMGKTAIRRAYSYGIYDAWMLTDQECMRLLEALLPHCDIEEILRLRALIATPDPPTPPTAAPGSVPEEYPAHQR